MMKTVWRIVLLGALIGAAACGRVADSASDGGPTNDEDGSQSTFDATPAGPVLTVDPTAHEFGSITVGGESSSMAFVFRNEGTAPVTGCSAPQLAGDHPNDFGIASDQCAFNDLPVGASCSVNVVASPQLEGARTATLSRDCTEGSTATTVSNGIGVNRPMYIFISSVTFTGDLGGLEGADCECATLAAAGSQTSGLQVTWKALLSKTTGGVVNARDRFTWTGPMFDVFGNTVTQNPASWPWQDDGGDNSSIEFNESGGPPADAYSLSGTTIDGLAQAPDLDCNGWADATNLLKTIAGQTGNFPLDDWLESFSSDCDETFTAMYCIGN